MAVSIELGLVRRSFTLFKITLSTRITSFGIINHCQCLSSSAGPLRNVGQDGQQQSVTIRKKVSAVGNAGFEKAETISKAMKAYLEQKKEHDQFMESEIADYEIGKRHLANIMGVDPENFSQDDINRAVQYLLPSGIHDRKARPHMKHPFQTIPPKKAAQFGADGRPHHTLFYTGLPKFYQLMHDVVVMVEELKDFEDKMLQQDFSPDPHNKINLLGSEWISKLKLESELNEKLTDENYKNFVALLEHMAGLSYAYRQHDYLFKYRTLLPVRSEIKTDQELQTASDGRLYQVAEGKRKSCMATVNVWEKGQGNVNINNKDMLAFFPRLIDREQLLYPLQLSGLLGAVDVEAHVEGGGPSGQAGAVRLGLSRALTSFVDGETAERMRLGGLLTSDPRIKERKKAGQEGARRKYTWKKR